MVVEVVRNGWILDQIETTEFARRLVGKYRRKESRMTPRFLAEHLKGWSYHQLRVYRKMSSVLDVLSFRCHLDAHVKLFRVEE